MTVAQLIGDCRTVLPSLPDASVHCVVTSPPYWGLRDYGHDGQLGLEPDFNAYVANMVGVFREVRRVLRDAGTLWLNLGDSYASQGGYRDYGSHDNYVGRGPTGGQRPIPSNGLKPKDLCGIPWRVAFALQADGWYLRQDIIWSKPNPMPESVTDRCTKAHEYLFLLSKRERYYYDAEAIREEGEGYGRGTGPGAFRSAKYQNNSSFDNSSDVQANGRHGHSFEGGRNKRSVWEVTTQPFNEAHFATFPPALIEPCIKAGTSEKGCCGICGKPWTRQVESGGYTASTSGNTRSAPIKGHLGAMGERAANLTRDGFVPNRNKITQTLGWSPSCACAADPVPCTVLDPFAGAGTTGLVADRLQRNAVLIELNPTYAAMSQGRITDDAPLFAEVTDGTRAARRPAELRSRL